MAWRTAATVIIVVFALIIIWMTMADPLVQVANAFQDIETSGNLGTNSKIDSMVRGWFNMILVAVFGFLGWGVWRVLRRELTQGRL